MPGGRLQPLARAMREYVQLDIQRRGGHEPTFEEAITRIERRQPSRREVLKMGGAVGAALTLAACTGSAPSRGRPRALPRAEHDARVAIVGAGLAGTTAAYRLAERGVRVQLFEARNRVGGRCWSARDFAAGQIAEHGGEFIDTRHVHLRGLARELGLKLDDLWTGWVEGSVWPEWVDGRVFDHEVLAQEMRRISKAVTAEAHRIGVLLKDGKPSESPYYYGTVTRAAIEADELNMDEWLDRNVPGVGQNVRALLNTTMAGWYGLDMRSLTALNWIDFFVIPTPGGDERWHVQGGNDQVPNVIARMLPAGTVRLGAALQSMVKLGDGTYQLLFSDSSQPAIADFVILTTPWTALREVDLEGMGFGPYRLKAIRELGMGTNAKLIVQYAQRPQRFKVRNGGVWSGGMEHTAPSFETWESSAAQEGAAGLITVFAGGSDSTVLANRAAHVEAPKPIVGRITDAINDVVPGSEHRFNGRAWLDYWPGDRWVHGSYAAYLPGQLTRYWGYAGIPENNVHFAGEHTSTYSQGFLNGGVESGQRTAIEVMDKLGIRVPRSIASLPYSRIPRR